MVAFAVIDDLGAIVLIALFYSGEVNHLALAGALLVWAVLLIMNRFFRITRLLPYLIGGVVMWIGMYKSGIHATITGVMLAFAIPFSSVSEDQASPSHRLENFLHKPVALLILPLFALANTGVVFHQGWLQSLTDANSIGIAAGLIIGKPSGVLLLCFLAVYFGVCKLPDALRWSHIAGAGMLGGIGFTMSIFITNLAFADDAATINASKMAILLSSMLAGLFGYVWLKIASRTEAG